MSERPDFQEVFRALTGNVPFPWQEALYKKFVDGEFPPCCNLPTGLGKTSVITIWLIALANAPEKVPRRLVYIVNRRTVVDQATEESELIREHLLDPARPEVVTLLFHRLASLCSSPSTAVPLAISTLRGQFADNSEWRSDPARPAIISGTIDMIGSRLLFSGYGCGFKTRPLHAGFLGQDSLIVHDEAHLEPAFQDLLCAIRAEQDRCGDFRPLRIIELTATSRADGECFGLSERDREYPEIEKRIKATKSLTLHAIEDDKKLPDTIATLAMGLKDRKSTVLIYVRRVEDVEKTLAKLPAGVKQQLTGTLRGRERDELRSKDPIFRRFLPKPKANGETVYLVCTSAGEVGVNISADHLVCDLATFESMAQRFGRVNRFGIRSDTEIHVVHPREFADDSEMSARLKRTLNLLRELNGSGSPLALNSLDPLARLAAFSPPPEILPVTDILFDSWTLTTIPGKLPGRPPIESYLHGVNEWEPPRTYVAWRKEVSETTGDVLDTCKPQDLLDDYPLKPHELLSDRSDRVFDKLQALAGRHPNAPVWVIDKQEEITTSWLGRIADPSAMQAALRKPLIARIERCTILLAPIVGGLNGGILDGASSEADDVADIESPAAEKRIRLWSDDEEYVEKTVGMRLVRSVERSRNDGDEEAPTWDWYKHKPLEEARTAQRPVLWDVHVDDAVREIDRILAGLSLPEEIAGAVRVATKLHDHGKRRPQFQFMLGNRAFPELVLAKSGRTGAKLPETYRHEFGSLADVRKDSEFQQLSDEMQDLVLHLIAAHHGRGRPCFSRDETFDPEHSENEANVMAAEVARRFGHLQRKYGRWGLAYLESLVRAADWAASAEPSKFLTQVNEVPQ